jgi:Leucine-rich repeat (LRR) protein
MNQITAFYDNSFKDLTQLDTLLLDSNRLVYILKDTFAGLDNLRQLSLNNNKVLFVNVKAFRDMRHLEVGEMGEFRMSKNPIERIRLIDGMVYFY